MKERNLKIDKHILDNKCFNAMKQLITQTCKYELVPPGILRATSKMTVQGSVRMVISPSVSCINNSVHIPKYIADKCVVPVINGNHFYASTLSKCKYAVLVRQPCMWSGGIQPVRITISSPIYDKDQQRDVNSSIRIPLCMCTPFGADFDGDEMTIFGIQGLQSEKECEAFQWDHARYNPYDEDDYYKIVSRDSQVVQSCANTIAICTTICWTDRITSVAANNVHKKWMTTVSGVIGMTTSYSVRDLIQKSTQSTNNLDTLKYIRSSMFGTFKQFKLDTLARDLKLDLF